MCLLFPKKRWADENKNGVHPSPPSLSADHFTFSFWRGLSSLSPWSHTTHGALLTTTDWWENKFFFFQVVCQWRRFKLRLWARQKKKKYPRKIANPNMYRVRVICLFVCFFISSLIYILHGAYSIYCSLLLFYFIYSRFLLSGARALSPSTFPMSDGFKGGPPHKSPLSVAYGRTICAPLILGALFLFTP